MADEKLTHVNEAGEARMVDVGAKAETEREAVAVATVQLRKETLDLIEQGQVGKGDVFAAARIAGIMAAKRTWELIPLCHPLQLTHVGVTLQSVKKEEGAAIRIMATVRNRGRTGVEMEALTAVSIAALTVYDMCKAVDREMVVSETYLSRKRGGRSGEFVHPRQRGDASIL